MAGLDLDNCGAHALGIETFHVGAERLIFFGDHVTRRNGLGRGQWCVPTNPAP